ncbi:MAG: hypothetical protein ABIF01_05055 [Candidatus Micrarchaeota archaeon]
MKIFGFEHQDYIEVCKKPVLAYLAWLFATTVLSFISFDAYGYSSLISVFVYFGAAAYIGWAAVKAGMGWKRALFCGAVYGIVFGIAQSIVWAFLMNNNGIYYQQMEPQIIETVDNVTASGMTITKEEVVQQYALFSVAVGPFFFGIVFGATALIAGFAAKIMGKEPKEEPEDLLPRGKTEKTYMPTPRKKKRRR